MTATNPPPGFITLDRAVDTAGKPFDVIGVCVDHLEPTKTRGTDYVSTFTLCDPSWYRGHGLKFRFFNGSEANLPRIQANGDVVILRNVTIQQFNGETLGLSNLGTSWAVLSGSTVLGSTSSDGSEITFVTSGSRGYNRPPAPTAEQLAYAKNIVSSIDPTTYRPPPKATALQIENVMKGAGGTPPPRQDKWQLIKDLTANARVGHHNFADLFGEVRKSWYNDYGRVNLSLTDYTPNKALYKYTEESSSKDGDEFNYSASSHDHWPGPWGRMTIEILLFDAHADFARSHVKPGMYVLVRNCQVKLDPNGSKLEAVCRGDKQDIHKVNVIIQKPSRAGNDARFQGLLQRKLEYEKYAKSKGLRFGFGSVPNRKRATGTTDGVETKNEAEVEAESNPKRKSKATRQRLKQEAATAAKRTAQNQDDNDNDKAQQKVNQHVRCENIEVPVTPLSAILDPSILHRTTPTGNSFSLPFQNCSYKCKVRVVDYWPRDLRDFSVPYSLSDSPSSSFSLPFSDDGDYSDEKLRWEWRFILLVEDASIPPPPTSSSSSRQQLPLLVSGSDGEYLLNAEATDLHARPIELNRLKEKMFVLWGNLQEIKEMGEEDKKVKARPFECFVKEYGVQIKVPGADTGADADADAGAKTETGMEMEWQWQRMFRLFGTST